MKEILTIRNFGSIKDMTLELSRFNIIIGENGTGKSTFAKVLAVCKYFSYITWNGYFEIPGVKENHFILGLQAWGLGEYIKSNSFIHYQCQHYSLTVENKIGIETEWDEERNTTYNIEMADFSVKLEPVSEDFRKLLLDLENLKPKPDSNYSSEDIFWRTPSSFFQNNVAKLMDNPFYLPTERGLQSLFSLGKSSIQNIADSLFNQFARIDQIVRMFKNEVSIEPLGIDYKNDNGKGYFRKKEDDKYFSLFNAASGYQSTIPIVLIIKYYNEIKKKSKTFIIEEPELNLFPLAQNKLMNFLVENIINYDNSILITTHSPYILTSLNNMMYAYIAGEKEPDEINGIINKRYWINPNAVSAYMLLPNGKCENIMDGEGLIKAEKIDSVSNLLNRDFNALMDIELKTNK